MEAIVWATGPRPSCLRLSEQCKEEARTLIPGGPLRDRPDVCQPLGAHLVYHDGRWNPVATAIGRNAIWHLRALLGFKVDHSQPAPGLQRGEKAPVDFRRAREVMVDVPHEDRVATRVRKIRRSRGSFQHRDVRKALPCYQLPYLRKHLWPD